ncbi:MAG TPA: hypothetical protein VF680_11590 [Allosphingosinicella sp.]|jgi:hypothetical protein
MQASPDLTIMALAALEEAATRTGDAPVPPSPALRFVLAWLYSRHGGERWPYDGFWRAVTRGHGEAEEEGAAAIGRSQSANANLNALYRAAGVERTPARIYSARSGTSSRAKKAD